MHDELGAVMTIPSTDPNRFAIALRTRELTGDDLDEELARDRATYEILERPLQEVQLQQQQAAIYQNIREESPQLWPKVCARLLDSGFDLRTREANGVQYAPVPTTAQLLELCRLHVLALLGKAPQSELYGTLVCVLQESTELRLSDGAMSGLESSQVLTLQEIVHGLYNGHLSAIVGTSQYGFPNL